MSGFTIDLIILAIIGFCTWQGYRKGLILSVCSVLIVIIASWGAGSIAASFADEAAEAVAPVLSWMPDVQIDEAIKEVTNSYSSDITDTDIIAKISTSAFGKIGMNKAITEALTEKVLTMIKNTEADVRESIANVFLYAVAYFLLLLFSFIVLFAALSLLAHFLSSIFKLPVLNLIDKFGGIAVGLIFGLLIMAVVGWSCRFAGIFVSTTFIEKSGLLKFFMNFNILSGMLNIK